MTQAAVIFDSDGVVVDSEPFSLAAFREAMEAQGVHLSDEDIMANCGLTDADICDYVFKKYGTNVDVEEFHTLKQKLYEQKVKEKNLQPCPGVTDLLNEIEGKEIPYALASSGSSKKITFNLSRVNLLHRFPVIISGEQMERGKPDPDIFLTAAENLKTHPDYCVVIEDSLNGIEAAKRAGMYCVGVAGTFPAERLQKADFVVESLEEVTVKTLLALVNNKKSYKGGGSK